MGLPILKHKRVCARPCARMRHFAVTVYFIGTTEIVDGSGSIQPKRQHDTASVTKLSRVRKVCEWNPASVIHVLSRKLPLKFLSTFILNEFIQKHAETILRLGEGTRRDSAWERQNIIPYAT
jgi:hypothetical protein